MVRVEKPFWLLRRTMARRIEMPRSSASDGALPKNAPAAFDWLATTHQNRLPDTPDPSLATRPKSPRANSGSHPPVPSMLVRLSFHQVRSPVQIEPRSPFRTDQGLAPRE